MVVFGCWTTYAAVFHEQQADVHICGLVIWKLTVKYRQTLNTGPLHLHEKLFHPTGRGVERLVILSV